MNSEGNRSQNGALIWSLIDEIHSKIQNHCSRKRFVWHTEAVTWLVILPLVVIENMVHLFSRISWRNALKSRILWKEIMLGFRQKGFTSLVCLLSLRVQCHSCGWCGWYKGCNVVHVETESLMFLCFSSNCPALERAYNGQKSIFEQDTEWDFF